MSKHTKKYIDNLTYNIIGAAIEFHKELGPGLLESVYEICMIKELTDKGIFVESQQNVYLEYKGTRLDALLRYDLLVEKCIVVELKAVTDLHPIHEAKVMTYARLLKVPKAILINFTCTNIFKEGQRTYVNEYYSELLEE